MHEITAALAANRVAPPVGLDVTDPENAELVALLARDVPTIRVMELYDEVDGFIAEIQAKLGPAIARRNALRAIVDAKMRDAKAEITVHGELRAVMKAAPKTTERRVEVLAQLYDLQNEDGAPLIPFEDLSKAVWTETKTETKTHLTHLRKLAKYGERVQAILDAGIVESRGLPMLVIERVPAEPRNVTPAIAEDAA